MKSVRLIPIVALVTVGLFGLRLSELAAGAPPPQPPQSSSQAPSNAPVVYVSDFELDVYRAKAFPMPRSQPSTDTAASVASSKTAGASADQPGPRSSAPGLATSTVSPAQTPSGSLQGKPQRSSTDIDPDEAARNRANEMVNVMAQEIVSSLRRNGYEAQRLRRNQPRPESGLLIRGVFAESDDQNRARRLLFGGPSTSPKMILYVGVNNLKNPEQALYELASPPAPDNRYGPVITITSYSPAARFELAKKPSDDEIKEIAAQIAAGLSSLISSNPLIFQ